MHDPTFGYALSIWCSTSEFGLRPCLVCKMASSPRATRCDNWARGCTGGATDFGPALINNATPGSPAFLLGRQVGAQVLEHNQLRIAAREANRAAQPGQFRRGCPTGVRFRGSGYKRAHQVTRLYSVSLWCHLPKLGSQTCSVCKLVSSPRSTRCD